MGLQDKHGMEMQKANMIVGVFARFLRYVADGNARIYVGNHHGAIIC